MRSPTVDASLARARYFSMIWRALPRTAGPLFPPLWFRGFPPGRPSPRPCERFGLEPCLVRYEFKLIPSFEVRARPPTAIMDDCPHSRTPSLDDWFGGFAVSSQSLVAQHYFAISNSSTNLLPRHAFKSSSNAFASFRSAAANSLVVRCSVLAPDGRQPRLLVTWSPRRTVIVLHFDESRGGHVVAPGVEIEKAAIAIAAESLLVVSSRI